MNTRLFGILVSSLSLLGPVAGAQGDPCSMPGADDALEDNDSCPTPVSIVPGLYSDLVVRSGDSDYYEVTLQPGERVDVSDPDQGGPSFALYDASCMALTQPSSTADYTNTSQVTETVVVEATTAVACQTYDMLIQVASICGQPPEEDSCTNPLFVTPPYDQTHSLSTWDDDTFAFCVPAGATATARMTYVDFLGYGVFLSLYVWDGTCSNAIGVKNIFCCTTEQVVYTNASNVNQYVIARVTFSELGTDCGSYDLTIDLDGPPCTPPTVYCTGKLSTAGCVPQIATSGAPSASIPAPFQIDATDVVNFKNGIVFYGFAGPANVPFLGGTLCVTPPLRRAPIQNSGGSPPTQLDCTGQFAFDFNAWIQSGADPFLSAGTQVNAQYWFRDPQSTGGAGLTDAVEFEIAQ